MNIFWWISFFLSLKLTNSIENEFILPPTNVNHYDGYGSLLVMNEHLAILAQNDQEYFTIIRHPFTRHWKKCVLPYNIIEHRLSSMTRFVYNIALGKKQNESQLVFSYINENWQRDVFLTIVFLMPTDTGCLQIVNQITVNITDLGMQERSHVAMDPHGKRAYAIGIYHIVCVDIETSSKWQIDTAKLFNNGNNSESLFFPKASVITEDQFLFIVGQKLNNFQFFPYLFVLNITSMSDSLLVSSIKLSDFNFGSSSVDMSRYTTMSICLSEHIEQFLIGIPSLDMLIFLSWNRGNISEEPRILRRSISSKRGISYGKSITLFDDRTFAVLAHQLSTLPWSTSQVQVSPIIHIEYQ